MGGVFSKKNRKKNHKKGYVPVEGPSETIHLPPYSEKDKRATCHKGYVAQLKFKFDPEGKKIHPSDGADGCRLLVLAGIIVISAKCKKLDLTDKSLLFQLV